MVETAARSILRVMQRFSNFLLAVFRFRKREYLLGSHLTREDYRPSMYAVA
jgi:hypothetical protein